MIPRADGVSGPRTRNWEACRTIPSRPSFSPEAGYTATAVRVAGLRVENVASAHV